MPAHYPSTNVQSIGMVSRMTTHSPNTALEAPTTAERRALAQISDASGLLAVIAADHGDPLVEMLQAQGLPSDPGLVRAIKYDIVDAVGRDASAVLLDPDVSVTHIVDQGALARDVGLLVRIEADGFVAGDDGLRKSQMIDGLGAAGARERGATAAKVMVFVRPDREDLDGHTARLVRDALEDCRANHLLCVIEAMTYRLDDESPETFAARRGELVRDSAVLLEACGAKLLKLEYPGDLARCEAVSAAISTPWAVLSAGVDHQAFCGQLVDSLEGGAAGFIAGRSLWKESVGMPAAERRAFLDGTVRVRFEELLGILEAHGASERGVTAWAAQLT
jgi:tagatose 1,6-diphosphate aldolase